MDDEQAKQPPKEGGQPRSAPEPNSVPESGFDVQREFALTPAIIIVLNSSGAVTDINPAGERILGFPKSKIVGREWFRFLPGRLRKPVKEVFKSLVAGSSDTYSYYENPVLSSDGREIPIGWSNAVVRDDSGKPTGTISVGLDISELVTARRARERVIALQETLAETSSLDTALAACLETALSISPSFDAGGIYLFEKSGELVLRTHKGLSKTFVEDGSSYKPGDPQWEMVMRGKPLYGSFSEVSPQPTKAQLREGLKSLGVIPIVYSEKVIGDLNVSSRVTGLISQAEREWVELLAGSIGGAISRIRLEEKLATSEQRLREFIEGAEDVLFSLDKEGRMEFVSPQVERYGWKAADLIGKHMLKVIHPDDHQRIIDEFREMLSGRESLVTEFRALGADGRSYWMESASRVRLGEDGRSVIGTSGVLRDITDRMRDRRALEESEARFRTLVENIGDIIFELSPDGRVVYVSSQIRRIGLDVNDIYNKTLTKMVYPEDREQAERNLKEIVDASPSSVVSTIRILDGEKKVRWVEATAALKEMADGSKRIFGALRDITERKEAEEKLEKERKKYRRVFESSNDAIMLLTAEKFFDCNEATARVFGYANREEFLGKHPGEVSPPFQADGTPSKEAADECIATAFREGKNFFEWTHRRADGTDFPATVLLTPLELEGRVVLQATVRDITKEKEAEQRIRALDQLKTRFITTLTHVTRTPLNRVRWSLETIESGQMSEQPLSEEEKALIRQALESEDEVLQVIDNMNTALDIERGTLVLDKAPASIVSLIRSVRDRFAQMPEMSEVEWAEELPKKKFGVVNLDSTRMRTVLNAMFDNALKYRKPGKNRIVVSLLEKGRRIRCGIQDSGIGVPADELPYVFQRFFRASNAQLKYTEGTGLGLYIAKSIVEKHGGTMGCESQENEGTLVWFELPMD